MIILFCGISLSRADILKTFASVAEKAQCFFLENFTKDDISNPYVFSIGKVIFWSEYRDAFQLLERIKPDKLIFVLLDNYYHLALFTAAKKKGIPVSYVDHGIRFEEEIKNAEQFEAPLHSGFRARIKKMYPLVAISFMRNSFFRNTSRQIDKHERRKLRILFFSRGQQAYASFMKAFGSQVIPDHFILYSPETWKFYKKFFSVPDNANIKITYTGIPSLDLFSGYNFSDWGNRKSVLFIDQPLHEQKVLGWTKIKKYEFFIQLAERIMQSGYGLIIKPHPWNEDIYARLQTEHGVQVLRDGMEKYILESSVAFIGSFNSTLLLPFCAMDDVVTFCMENHPLSLNPPLSAGITKYKTAVEIKNMEQLSHLLDEGYFNLAQKRNHIPHFINEALFAFDGRSSQRMEMAILS
jgi:Alpha-2,8-polysialyltransferase (POLYST)